MTDQITIPQLFVQTRLGWSDPWETIPYLEVDRIDWPVSAVSTATLRWSYGSIDDGLGTYDTYEFISQPLGTFCRICRPPRIDEGEDDEPQAVWHGVITSDPDSIGGSDTADPVGDQTLGARSLEFLLARSAVDGSIVLNEKKIDEVLPFNLVSTAGNPILGNRSIMKGENPANGLSSYVFTDDAGNNKIWTGRDIVEYLLTWFAPASLAITATGQTDNLDLIKQVFPAPADVWSGILAVVDRRRGHHCMVDVHSLDGTVILRIGSCFGEKVSAGGVEIAPASSTQTSLDADADAITELILREDAEHQYDRIVVQGEPVILCGTLKFAESTLKTGWGSTIETTYKAADDLARTKEEYSNVYRAFLADTDNLPDGPSITADGQIDAENPPTQFYLGKGLLRHLPLAKNADDSDGPVEFRPPLILIKGKYKGSTIYAPVTRPLVRNAPAAGMGLVMLDGEMGFRLTGKYGHYMADGHFAGAAASRFPAVFDYEEITATVAWTSSEIFSVITEIDNGGLDFTRTLLIRVPDAECWYQLADTVTDIDASGALVTSGPTTLRHDRDKLAIVAALAAAWYEKPRRAVTVSYSTLVFDFNPGDFITDLQGRALDNYKVNTPISRIVWNAAEGTTTIQTDFADLDFVAVAGLAGPGSAGPRPSAMLAPGRRDKAGNLAVADGANPGPLPETPFAVLVTQDGGVAGSKTAECTYTYTVKALDDATTLRKNNAGDLATGMTPERPRYHYVEYWYAGETRTAPATATSRYGEACYDSNGDLHLLVAYGEIDKDTAC